MCAIDAIRHTTYGFEISNGSNQGISLTPKKVSKIKAFDAYSAISIEGIDNGIFAIAASKKELNSS